MSRLWQVPGSPSALFVDGDTQLLHPQDQVFEAMLAGWRDQQLARNLNSSTIHNRDADVRRFQRFTNDYPWLWRPQDVEEFSADMRGAGRRAALSTVRGFQGSLRLFLEYAAALFIFAACRYTVTDATPSRRLWWALVPAALVAIVLVVLIGRDVVFPAQPTAAGVRTPPVLTSATTPGSIWRPVAAW